MNFTLSEVDVLHVLAYAVLSGFGLALVLLLIHFVVSGSDSGDK